VLNKIRGHSCRYVEKPHPMSRLDARHLVRGF